MKFSASVTRHSLVLLAVVSEDQVLELDLNLDPLLVRERRPDVMRLRHCRLVRLQDDLRPVVVDVQCSQYEDETRERLRNENHTYSLIQNNILRTFFKCKI